MAWPPVTTVLSPEDELLLQEEEQGPEALALDDKITPLKRFLAFALDREPARRFAGWLGFVPIWLTFFLFSLSGYTAFGISGVS